jgi:hypothetical protein
MCYMRVCNNVDSRPLTHVRLSNARISGIPGDGGSLGGDSDRDDEIERSVSQSVSQSVSVY